MKKAALMVFVSALGAAAIATAADLVPLKRRGPLAFDLVSSSCKVMGSAPGRRAEPTVIPGTGFVGACHQQGDEVLCAMGSQKQGSVDAHTGTQMWSVKFPDVEMQRPYFLMVSDDHLNFVMIDIAAGKFSWSQTTVDLAGGATLQKQCMGTSSIK